MNSNHSKDIDHFIQRGLAAFHDGSSGLLLLARWSRAAGTRDYLFFREYSQFESFCRTVPQSTHIVAFTSLPEPLLIRRGVSMSILKDLIRDGKVWLMVKPALPQGQWSHLTAPCNECGQYEYELDEELATFEDGEFFFFPEVPSWEGANLPEIVIGNILGVY